ncbi:MAG: hypothetical protein M1826_005509 [Phylliscum demangeonii]|nr:MAG: hypothetical protein M1826_005509 [Phylliscum demangeonii]
MAKAFKHTKSLLSCTSSIRSAAQSAVRWRPISTVPQTRPYSTPSAGSIPLPKQKYVPQSGTYPRGFLASGTHVGVKASTAHTQKLDLALIVSERPCSAAAVFTQNQFQAAPVLVSKEVLKASGGSGVRGVVINSGCANAVTGRGGLEDAESMKKAVDECLGPVKQQQKEKHEKDVATAPASGRTLVMSTGVIGQRLPIHKILAKIPQAHANLSSSHAAWLAAATAICTTDTFPKLLSREFTLPSSPNITYRLAGMTKGAGMIHPNMATLLAVLCTDAAIAPPLLRQLLAHAVARSFNSISIDGDTSTNDTVGLLANGAAHGPLLTLDDRAGDQAAMQAVLTAFATDLAQLVVRDGEGATKFVAVRVTGAPSHAAAHAIAAAIARSPLVKTALYGKDANWGRILSAVGSTPSLAPATIRPHRTSVSFIVSGGRGLARGEGEGEEKEELKLLVCGEPEPVDERRARALLERDDLEIVVRLRDGVPGADEDGDGDGGGEEACYWTCDFSHEYVTINADYRT